MNRPNHKMNMEEAVEFLSQVLSVYQVMDIHLNDFTPQEQDENNNLNNKGSSDDGSDFVTIQILEITEHDKYERSSSPRLFTLGMLDETNVISEDSSTETDEHILNYSSQEHVAQTNEQSDIVQIPLNVDIADNTNIETNTNNGNNNRDLVEETNFETNTNNEDNNADPIHAAYEADTDVEELNTTNSRSRKCKKNFDHWARNVKKLLRQSGQEYRDRSE